MMTIQIQFRTTAPIGIENILDVFNEASGIRIRSNDNFFEVGITSLTLMRAVEELNDRYKISLQPDDLFTHHTARKLLNFILHADGKSRLEDAQSISQEREEIAIVGIGLKLPGVNEIHEFWDNLVNGCELVSPLSGKRLENASIFAEKIYSGTIPEFKEAAYLNEIDCFDNRYFRISPNEAVAMPPAQRIMLESACKAIEDSGESIKKIEGQPIGVYVGYIGDLEGYKYQQILDFSEKEKTPTGILSSNIAGRLSFFLNINGPSMLVDCACSSSTAALNAACENIWNGACDAALVGGVRIMYLPFANQIKIGIESNDYRTRPFDAESSGTGDGEGVVCIFIKKLSAAIKDNNHIYAVIKGIACNQDGNSINLSAPNPEAQEQVVTAAYRKSGINPRTIGYLEAHGTGTVIGDPIEVHALYKAFAKFTEDKGFSVLGSVKGNIGHLYEASGIASIVKCCLMLDKKHFVPLKNYNSPNPKINFVDSPFKVITTNRQWEAKEYPRRCGVSNFGFSGTNLHLILEESLQIKASKPKRSSYAFPLSANSIESLHQLVAKMAKYLSRFKSELDLGNVCYTLSRRTAYRFRICIIAQDISDLISQLEQIANDDIKSKKGLLTVQNNMNGIKVENGANDDFSDSELEEMNRVANELLEMEYTDVNEFIRVLSKLRDFYCNGADVTWEKLYSNEDQVISLPSYTFEKGSFWPTLK